MTSNSMKSDGSGPRKPPTCHFSVEELLEGLGACGDPNPRALLEQALLIAWPEGGGRAHHEIIPAEPRPVPAVRQQNVLRHVLHLKLVDCITVDDIVSQVLALSLGCQVPTCSMICSSVAQLRTHTASAHGGQSVSSYRCLICHEPQPVSSRDHAKHCGWVEKRVSLTDDLSRCYFQHIMRLPKSVLSVFLKSLTQKKTLEQEYRDYSNVVASLLATFIDSKDSHQVKLFRDSLLNIARAAEVDERICQDLKQALTVAVEQAGWKRGDTDVDRVIVHFDLGM